MNHEKNRSSERRTKKLSVRLIPEHYGLVDDAAGREGLQISTFVIMMLVRVHVLPESCLKKIKRRPVPFFIALHGLLGVVNNIGGNCKQLMLSLPQIEGVRLAQDSLLQAAAAITDALQGKPVPPGVNLYDLESNLTNVGYVFNDIVRSVNMGKPQLSGLYQTLSGIAGTAEAITSALTGDKIATNTKILAALALDKLRADMKYSAKNHTKRQKDEL